jgi:hypothetical protein
MLNYLRISQLYQLLKQKILLNPPFAINLKGLNLHSWKHSEVLAVNFSVCVCVCVCVRESSSSEGEFTQTLLRSEVTVNDSLEVAAINHFVT